MSDDRAYQIHSLVNLLQTNSDGDDLARADELYRKVVTTCTEHVCEHGGTAKGELNLKIVFAIDGKGTDVTVESTHKLPKPPTTKTRYFVTDKGDGLTLRNPNRETMFSGVDLGRRRAGDVT